LFLSEQVKNEKILALTLCKLLKYNLQNIGFKGSDEELLIEY
jgi:hypothetical protein